MTRNLWGNGALNNYGTNSTSSNAYIGSGSGSVGGSTFGNAGVNWRSSAISPQGGGNNVSNNIGGLGYGSGDTSYGLGAGGYGRNSGASVGPTSSFAASNGGFEGDFADFYSSGSVIGDPTWRSSNSERDGSGPFGYGLGSAASDVSAKSSPGYVGGYSVNKRQPNTGKGYFMQFLNSFTYIFFRLKHRLHYVKYFGSLFTTSISMNSSVTSHVEIIH